MNAYMAKRMTSARIVTPGQAMGTIPTMRARTARKISEVDSDLNMTVPFVVGLETSEGCDGGARPTPAAYERIAAGSCPAHRAGGDGADGACGARSSAVSKRICWRGRGGAGFHTRAAAAGRRCAATA